MQGVNVPRLVLIAFLGGLFLLAFGAGLWFFKGQQQPEVEVLSATDSNSAKIVIQIDGAVNKPGVYELAFGARVNDAISAAGGLNAEADQTRINLAAKVADGQKVMIAKIGEPTSTTSSTSSKSTTSSTSLININTGSASDLDKLPGVGPATAEKIIAGRPYSSLDEILTKKAVSSSVWQKIKDLISF